MSMESLNKASGVGAASASSSVSGPESAGTLLKRSKPSESLRGLDLAIEPKTTRTVAVRDGAEHSARIERISGQVDSSRLGAYSVFSPVSSLRRATPSTSEERALMNKNMNNVINRVLEAPTTKVETESAMAVVFSKHLGGVLTGLRQTTSGDLAAKAADLAAAITNPDTGTRFKSFEISALLRSPDQANQEKGMAALRAINTLCSDTALLTEAIKNSPYSANVQENTLDPLQVQTLFIKSSRGIMANILFESSINQGLNNISVPNLTLPEKSLSDYSANVGFNRLMSPNNMLGASHSSDVDFKLVLDDISLKKDLATANPHLDDTQLNQAVGDLKAAMKGVLDGAKDVMENQFSLTLEVADFTVKTISGIKEQLVNPKTSEIEQNFLATVLHNHSHMSGNKEVMNQFVDIIKDSLQFAKVATRNFDQYLGDSDKGSIKAMKNLPAMESVVNRAAEIVSTNPAMFSAAINKLFAQDETRPDAAGLAKKLVEEPTKLKKLLDVPEIKAAIMSDAQINTDIGKVDMFKGINSEKKLELTLKLVSTFTKEVDGEVNRSFIGKPGVSSNDNWIFSVKYAGCRLNDVFDSTPKSVYVLSSNNVAAAEKKYDAIQSIAEPINSFSIQLQNRTYELARAKDPDISHADIDELYDRVTADEFAQMLQNEEMLPKMKVMVDNLVGSLDSASSQAKGIMGDGNLQKLRDFQTALSGDLSAINLRELGHNLFNTVFTLTDNAAIALKPEKTSLRSLTSQTI